MAVSFHEFVRRLIRSRLMTEREVTEYVDTFPPEKRPPDGDAMAAALMQDERLNRWQAAAVLRGAEKGLVLGEFVLLDQVGKGGMGRVFKALHRPSGAFAAIKVLPEEAAQASVPSKMPMVTETTQVQDNRPSAALSRFHQEVLAASRLCHRNIVSTYDAGEEDGIHYLVMEYVDGRDLGTLVQKHGPLPVDSVIGWILQAARGLEYAHAKNVIHRDIKPGNLLLNQEGTIKILDMGLARVVEEETMPLEATLAERLTVQGEMLGTVDYVSPEQAVDTRSADRRSDIYSLGCTLYRLVAGKPVYKHQTPMGTLLAHLESPIPFLRDARPGVSAELDAVFRKMVAKRPGDRYASMSEVIAALEACPESGVRPRQASKPASAAGHRPCAQGDGKARVVLSEAASGSPGELAWDGPPAVPGEKGSSPEQGTGKISDSATSSIDRTPVTP